MAIRKRFPEETLDSMLRRFKKETLKSEVLKDLRKKEYYVSPSEKKRLKSAEARKRLKKKLAKMNMY